MKKKIFSFILSLFMFLPCMAFAGCGKTPPDSSSGSGDLDEGNNVATVSTLYDMKVASLTGSDDTNNQYHNTLIMLPDGKIMAIDLCLTNYDAVYDFMWQYERMIGIQLQKYTEDYLYRIDYVIDTGKTWFVHDDFFSYFKVKNFYRVNTKQHVDMWARDYLNLGYEDKTKEAFVERIKALPSEYWTGAKSHIMRTKTS